MSENSDQPPQQPAGKPPKADINTLAYLLKEIEIRLTQEQQARHKAGVLLLVGSAVVLVGCAIFTPQPNLSIIVAIAACLFFYGYSKVL